MAEVLEDQEVIRRPVPNFVPNQLVLTSLDLLEEEVGNEGAYMREQLEAIYSLIVNSR